MPIYQRLRRDETVEQIDALCEKQGWLYSADDREYLIETPVGKWRITLGTQPVDVYHINKVATPNNTDLYHKQHRLFLSMTDTVKYIRQHDATLMEKENQRKAQWGSLLDVVI